MVSRKKRVNRATTGYDPIFLAHRLGGFASFVRQPRIASRIQSGVVGIQVNETTLDQEITNLEDITPTSGVRHACAPRSIGVLAGARSLDGKRIRAGHDPVECGIVVEDMLDKAAEVGE